MSKLKLNKLRVLRHSHRFRSGRMAEAMAGCNYPMCIPELGEDVTQIPFAHGFLRVSPFRPSSKRADIEDLPGWLRSAEALAVYFSIRSQLGE
nr:hypothetical protein [Cupriavidus sp. SK-3]